MCKRLFFLISVVLLLSMAGNASAELKALWEFDEGEGTIVPDSIGSYNGTMSGDPAWVDGNDCGGALDFDGDDAVRIGTYPLFNPTGSFSISLWAYIAEWETSWGDAPMANRGNGDGWALRHFGSYWEGIEPDDPNYAVTDAFCFTTRGMGHASDNIEDTPSKTVPPTEEWIHIACVYDHTNHKKYIYFDGVEDTVWDTNATDANYNPSWQSVYIGSRSNANDSGPEDYYFYTGKLDDVRFYDHALSPAEVIPDYMEARKADPYNNETITVISYVLQWEPGCGIASADDYHVWFSEDWNDVNDSTEDANEGTTGGDNFYDPGAVNRDGNYYWRIDTIEGATTYRGYIWTFYVQPEKAYDPDPCDFHGFVPVEPMLTWKAGSAAKPNGHNVYFGYTFAEVSDAPTGSTNPPYRASLDESDTDWAPSESGLTPLALSTTHYWRIDEVGPPIVKGDVWRFTTVPWPGLGSILCELWNSIQGAEVNALTDNIRYPDNPSESTESSFFESPYTGEDTYAVRMHGWLYIYPDDTNDYRFWIASDDNSQLWLSTDESSDNAVKIAYLEGPDCPAGYSGAREWDKYPAQRSNLIHLVGGNAYYIMALQKENDGGDHLAVGWSFTTDPNDVEVIPGKNLVPYEQRASFRPAPMDRDTDVRSKPTLNWRPGKFIGNKCKFFDVYFDTDEDAVTDANRSSDPCQVMVKKNYDSNSIDIADDPNVGLLKFDTTYYWRIDDVNENEAPSIHSGGVWSFTTDRHHAVEDFEKYANTTALKTVWHAHSDIKASSEIVCGQEHGGKQAMAILYNNSSSRSEAYADSNGTNSLEFGFNWRLQDVKALSLWLHGIPDFRGSYTGTDPYTLEGDGSGINSTTYDTYYYLYTEKAGQITGQVQARVDSIDSTSSSAMAGVMLRDTSNPDSIYAATVVTPNNEVKFMIRASTGVSSAALATTSEIALPHWIRITRGFSATSAEHANDVGGNPGTWEQVGPTQGWPIGPAPLYLGIFVTSSSYGDMCTAELSQVTMQSPVGSGISDPATEKDVGNYVYNAPEAMYVVLQDNDSNGIVYYENKDANVTQTADWEEWRIDMNEFIVQNVDPCNVRRMYIGIGDKDDPSSGSGTMYIDDIRLYTAEFYEPECPPLPADLVRDGEVDYGDLKVITDNWLVSDYGVTPVAPPNEPNLIAWYRLEGDPCDSANGFDANEYGIKTADYVAGMEGTWALDLKGDANYIETDSNAVDYGIDGNKPRTITAWAKTRSFNEDELDGIYEIGGHAVRGDFSMITRGTEPNQWRANHWSSGDEDCDIDFEYPSLNTWVHFAHTYDGTKVKIYLDGKAMAETELALDLNTAPAKNFSIGQWSYSNDYFDGTVDDVRIYNYALSQANAAYIARYPDANAFTQPLELLLTPQDPGINLFAEDPNMINFRDAAEMGNHWGETQIWPIW